VDFTAPPQKTELSRKAILSIKHVVKPLGGRDHSPKPHWESTALFRHHLVGRQLADSSVKFSKKR